MHRCDVSIVIPTLGRDQVLINTVASLLRLEWTAAEIILVDQTATHDVSTSRRLERWERTGSVRWLRRSEPSITGAMNHGLKEAKHPLVLFLDDDIRPRSELVQRHEAAHHLNSDLWATVGQVIQPWQIPADEPAPRLLAGLRLDEDFPFHSTRDMSVFNVMAGNLCVDRERAIAMGGFDERFQGAAYRFETEFARRIVKAGGRIQFLGSAGIDHLRAEKGGTRQRGSHLTSASPDHGIGDYYYALLHATSRREARVYCHRRLWREVRTRFHLAHPWWIPVKLVGEVRAYLGAKRLIKESHGVA